MNLLFRLLWVLLRGRRRARIDLFEEARLELRVWPTDLDLNLHLTNSRYLSMMDLGRTDLLVRAGALGLLLRRRWQPLVGSAVLRFRRPLSPFRRFSLVTRLLCWDEKWFYLEQRFESDQGVMAVGLVKGLFRGPRGNVAPAELLAALGYGGRSSPEPDAVLARWQAMEQALDGQLRGQRRAA